MRARKKWAITIIAFTVFVLIAVAGIYMKPSYQRRHINVIK